jgi:hypothetical protein
MIYSAIEVIKEELKAVPLINTITEGDLSDVDMDDKTIYPLAHIIVNTWQDLTPVVQFSVDIIFADIVDDSVKIESNKQDIWNQQALIGAALLQSIRTGSQCRKYLTELVSTQPAQLFTDRFENALAGTVVSFTFNMPKSLCKC